MELDLKDKKLLYELDLNSRQSYKELGKKVGLSKDSIIYRIENLQKQGVILKFQTILDVSKLGFTSFRLYIKLQNTTPKKEQEIIDYFKNKKIVFWIASAEGEYDLALGIEVRTIKEMNILWKDFLGKYLTYIEKRWLTIWTKVSYYPRAYLLNKKENDKEFVFISDSEPIEIDEKNQKILKLLADNSRISIVEISNKLRMTPKTVIKRIRELEEMQVILGYRTMFDIGKLGYQYFKLDFNLHHLTKEKEAEFRNFIKTCPNIVYDNEVLGGNDIELEFQVKSLEELRVFIEQIKQNFSDIIRNYKYMRFYKEYKYLFFPS